MTTPKDSAAVTQETALILHDLEYLRRITDEGICAHIIDAAIDRLIVLDNATHPRERALAQDAKRGNFRHQEDDGA